MHIRVNRRSTFIAGVAGTIGALVIGAAAFAGGGVGNQTTRPRTLAVAKIGQTLATLAPGATRDIKVLDAGTVSVTVDSTASTFTIGTIVESVGWKAAPTVVDGTNASVLFTSVSRRVVVTLAFNAGVLTVTITEVPQEVPPTTSTTPSTTAPSTTAPSTTAPSTTPSTTVPTPQVTTTVATTAATTTTPTTAPSTAPSTTTSVTVAGTTGACAGDEASDDGEQDAQECDREDGKLQTTSATSAKANNNNGDDKTGEDKNGDDKTGDDKTGGDKNGGDKGRGGD